MRCTRLLAEGVSVVVVVVVVFMLLLLLLLYGDTVFCHENRWAPQTSSSLYLPPFTKRRTNREGRQPIEGVIAVVLGPFSAGACGIYRYRNDLPMRIFGKLSG